MTQTNVNDLIKSIETNEIGGSIFSREDVIRILGMVQVQEQPQTTAIDLVTLMEDLTSVIDEITSIEVDNDSLEFKINYNNEVELESYELEREDAKSAVERIITKIERNEYVLGDEYSIEEEVEEGE